MKIFKVEFELPDCWLAGQTVTEIEEYIQMYPKTLAISATRIRLCSIKLQEETDNDRLKT